MSLKALEDRVAPIEMDLALLKSRLLSPAARQNHWVESIAGTFCSPKARAAFDEAMKYGGQWRRAGMEQSARQGVARVNDYF